MLVCRLFEFPLRWVNCLHVIFLVPVNLIHCVYLHVYFEDSVVCFYCGELSTLLACGIIMFLFYAKSLVCLFLQIYFLVVSTLRI